MKSKTTALILSILVGGLGIDRFYLGYTGIGVLKLLTGGCFGILYIIDIVNIATGNLCPADGSPYEDDKKAAAPQSSLAANAADELKKYKNLLDEGVITEEEFQSKKEQLLNLL